MQGRWGPGEVGRGTLTGGRLGRAAVEVNGRELRCGLVWLVLTDKARAEGVATLGKAVALFVAQRALGGCLLCEGRDLPALRGLCGKEDGRPSAIS